MGGTAVAVLVVGLVAAGGIGFVLYRQSTMAAQQQQQAAAAAAQQQSSTNSNSSSGGLGGLLSGTVSTVENLGGSLLGLFA